MHACQIYQNHVSILFMLQQCRALQQCQQCKSAASTGDHIARVIENQLFLGTPLDIQLKQTLTVYSCPIL